MSNESDFVIENGVLKKYMGSDTDITIPDNVTTIGYSAFYGCKKRTIHAPSGSYAETYAKGKNIPFVAE